MKIICALLVALLLLGVAGCAGPQARGGTSDAAIEGGWQMNESKTDFGQQDYGEILSSPGWF